ncbi:multifunctional nucleoside diphosphate kinase/apyrimidinic endonuclease/3'-phosphodiesterase [Staphylococcus epidermidis 36-1]|nr:multifunctional nucleoside diphosphate kinase/apyrimidinic endonuclease/3'-phosphodiesterase [Staphylococcus epidermidis 36-1]
MERTFLMIKPDAVQRNLIGEIISRIEKKGLKLVGGKFMQVPMELAEKHYSEHEGKPFYDKLISFITSAPVFAMVVEGENAVAVSRKIIGSTNPSEAAPGTIRGDYGLNLGRNIIHGSDSTESDNVKLNYGLQVAKLLIIKNQEKIGYTNNKNIK